ncbi:MAG: hypothetical protein DRO76_05135 [Candidatus Altiarchaeales archaeon]|nr:MAG: hypothetical protein DRO76_05135 [Candidatus Altiarchaeales archaeon]
MSKIILFSKKDPAGRNIARILRGDFNLSPLEYDKEILYMDELKVGNVEKETDLCIVASRHKSKMGKAS